MAFVSRIILLAFLVFATAADAAPDADRSVKPVHFSAGSHSVVIKGRIQGYRYVDHQLSARAGQQLAVSMQPGNRAGYFNILPPGSRNVAMFLEGAGDRQFDGLLADDGVYTVRVYLVRAAARRGETSSYSLSIGLSGMPLRPLPAKVDALIPGTRFHASAKVRCAPPYASAGECEAWVVRRGTDGTATVELRWEKTDRRRILFVKGKPESTDGSQPFTFTRNENGYVILFIGDERFEIPDALIFGG